MSKNIEPVQIRRDARKDLAQLFRRGDRVFIFGFSRGAAIARMFACRLASSPLSARRGGSTKIAVRVHFLGVWDTVASLGVPNLDDETEPQGSEIFENNRIAPNIARAVHLVSVDDQRLAFRPTLMNREARVEEIWLPGVHSDVGGGYRRDGLSDLALQLMMTRATAARLALRTPQQIAYDRLGDNGAADIDLDELVVAPDASDKLHSDAQRKRPEKVRLRTLKPRRVYVLKNNIPVSDPRPVLHHSVLQRIGDVRGYRPANLQSGHFRVLNSNGTYGEYGGWKNV